MVTSLSHLVPQPCSKNWRKSLVPDEKTRDIPKTWDKMGEDQLRLYASELAEIYRQEKELRLELSEKNEVLEKRVQELSALNAMFRKHLNMRFETKEAFKHLVGGINKLLDEAKKLKDSALPN